MRKLDARGLECPLPVVKTKELLKESSETVEVVVDNETAVENLKKFAKVKGYDAVSNKVNEDYHVVISSGEQVVEEKKADNILKGQIVVLSSDSLGSDKKLGKILMKSFIFALTKQDAFPETILFYNEGVKITTQESDTLNDLLFLESEGVEIVNCGTCLDFFKLKDDLKVGSITNMYDIVERMEKAEKVIKPN
ncbi:sulfurtransferase-like selenium metabolism protein YedF [uncultured Catenibacterium sp.]|uniref:sulfurtransferase-like selenium metabolism protein YedF n=1 Tax=uncultured Catenibacterium sp. TaxID=286142 RepID=UPI0025F11A1F|nr:sulfurtransferase-like selenium metabolism protein YedF [uncultured Catenibacterium sp.]